MGLQLWWGGEFYKGKFLKYSLFQAVLSLNWQHVDIINAGKISHKIIDEGKMACKTSIVIVKIKVQAFYVHILRVVDGSVHSLVKVKILIIFKHTYYCYFKRYT